MGLLEIEPVNLGQALFELKELVLVLLDLHPVHFLGGSLQDIALSLLSHLLLLGVLDLGLELLVLLIQGLILLHQLLDEFLGSLLCFGGHCNIKYQIILLNLDNFCYLILNEWR